MRVVYTPGLGDDTHAVVIVSKTETENVRAAFFGPRASVLQAQVESTRGNVAAAAAMFVFAYEARRRGAPAGSAAAQAALRDPRVQAARRDWLDARAHFAVEAAKMGLLVPVFEQHVEQRCRTVV